MDYFSQLLENNNLGYMYIKVNLEESKTGLEDDLDVIGSSVEDQELLLPFSTIQKVFSDDNSEYDRIEDMTLDFNGKSAIYNDYTRTNSAIYDSVDVKGDITIDETFISKVVVRGKELYLDTGRFEYDSQLLATKRDIIRYPNSEGVYLDRHIIGAINNISNKTDFEEELVKLLESSEYDNQVEIFYENLKHYGEPELRLD